MQVKDTPPRSSRLASEPPAVEPVSVAVCGTDPDHQLPDPVRGGDAVQIDITSVTLSRFELVAVLYELSAIAAADLASMSHHDIRQFTVGMLLAEGRGAVLTAASTMQTRPYVDAHDSAFQELCEFAVADAFDLARPKHTAHLDPTLPTAQAWAQFADSQADCPACRTGECVNRYCSCALCETPEEEYMVAAAAGSWPLPSDELAPVSPAPVHRNGTRQLVNA